MWIALWFRWVQHGNGYCFAYNLHNLKWFSDSILQLDVVCYCIRRFQENLDGSAMQFPWKHRLLDWSIPVYLEVSEFCLILRDTSKKSETRAVNRKYMIYQLLFLVTMTRNNVSQT